MAKLLEKMNKQTVDIETNQDNLPETPNQAKRNKAREWTKEENALILKDIKDDVACSNTIYKFQGTDRSEGAVRTQRHKLIVKMRKPVLSADKKPVQHVESTIIKFNNLPLKQAMMLTEYFVKNNIEFILD